MDDWKPLTDFPELETFFLEVKSFDKHRLEDQSNEDRLQKLVLSMSEQNFVGPETPPSVDRSAMGLPREDDSLNLAPPKAELKIVFEEPQIAPEAELAHAIEPTIADVLRRYRFQLALLIVIMATGASMVVRSFQENPRLPTQDIAKDEYQDLRRAMGESLKYVGPTAAIALSHTKIENPAFYVTANVEEGSKLEFSIDGLPETLVNRFRFSMQTSVTVHDNMAKTLPLTEKSGAALEPGAYRVRVRKAGESAIIAQKVYFLGGSQDLAYEQKLKAYQKSLRDQAALEIMELRQLTETVSHQLNDSSMKVTQLFEDTTIRGAARREKWSAFQTLWNQIDSQVAAIAAQWTPQVLENQIYYGALYSKLGRAISHVEAVHEAQTKLFLPDVKRDDVRAVIARESLSAQNLIQDLNTQVGKLEKLTTKVGRNSGLPPQLE
ncbi:hypothetical protein BH10BDE1_BH10BDE1_17260 [soil metagenome]